MIAILAFEERHWKPVLVAESEVCFPTLKTLNTRNDALQNVDFFGNCLTAVRCQDEK